MTILPIPASNISLFTTSLDETPATSVTIGEYVMFNVNVTLPKGTTMKPTIVVTMPTPYGLLKLVNATLAHMPNNIARNGYGFFVSSTYGTEDTITFTFESVVNKPEGARAEDSNVIVFTITSLVGVSPLNVVGRRLTPTSRFTHQTPSGTIVNESPSTRSISVSVVQPTLKWTAAWNVTTADAGDIVGCSVIVQHDSTSSAAAYNLEISSLLAPYFQLIPASVESNGTNVVLAPTATTRAHSGIVTVPVIAQGSVVSIKFSAILSTSVVAGSTITSQNLMLYASAPTNGLSSYLLYFDCYPLFICIL